MVAVMNHICSLHDLGWGSENLAKPEQVPLNLLLKNQRMIQLNKGNQSYSSLNNSASYLVGPHVNTNTRISKSTVVADVAIHIFSLSTLAAKANDPLNKSFFFKDLLFSPSPLNTDKLTETYQKTFVVRYKKRGKK